MEEIWKDAVGYEKFFKVSNLGRIYSKRTDRILRTVIHKQGYEVFCTRFGGKNSPSKLFKVHRLVATAFIPNPENKPSVNHVDGIKNNNSIFNLEWVTAKENTDHAFRTGLCTVSYGLESSAAKLTSDMLVQIFNESKQNGGTLTQRDLAKEFGVDKVAIHRVLHGTTYQAEIKQLMGAGLIVKVCAEVL